MIISAVLAKLFVLLFIKPDFSTVLAVILVAFSELLLLQVPRGVWVKIWFFIASGLSVLKLKNFLINAVYPDSSDAFFSVTIILALVFAVISGIRGVVRGYNFILVFFVFAFLFSGFGNISQFSAIEYSVSIEKLLSDALKILVFSPEILLLPKKTGKKFIVISNTALGICFLITVSVLGRVATTEIFPYYTVGTLAKISVFSRLDAVHSALWVLMGYFKGALLLNACKTNTFTANTFADLLHKDHKSAGQSHCAGNRN